MSNKARYWCGILYPENMINDWETEIGDIVQFPYCYCIHDKDLEENGDSRKTHVHLMLAFNNTTTQKHAFDVFMGLSRSGCRALSTVEPIFNIRNMYEYLIHNTETCRKKGKYLYSKKERITGNNFDIGSFEQISLDEKQQMVRELSGVIIDNRFTNYIFFYQYVMSNYDNTYLNIISSYSGHFERLCKGNFHLYGNYEHSEYGKRKKREWKNH